MKNGPKLRPIIAGNWRCNISLGLSLTCIVSFSECEKMLSTFAFSDTFAESESGESKRFRICVVVWLHKHISCTKNVLEIIKNDVRFLLEKARFLTSNGSDMHCSPTNTLYSSVQCLLALCTSLAVDTCWMPEKRLFGRHKHCRNGTIESILENTYLCVGMYKKCNWKNLYYKLETCKKHQENSAPINMEKSCVKIPLLA